MRVIGARQRSETVFADAPPTRGPVEDEREQAAEGPSRRIPRVRSPFGPLATGSAWIGWDAVIEPAGPMLSETDGLAAGRQSRPAFDEASAVNDAFDGGRFRK